MKVTVVTDAGGADVLINPEAVCYVRPVVDGEPGTIMIATNAGNLFSDLTIAAMFNALLRDHGLAG